MLNNIIEYENEFTSLFAETIDKDYGRLYYNIANKLSHDSNHAIIKNITMDIGLIVSEIFKIYESKSIVPRYYQSFNYNIDKVVIAYLLNNGYSFNELKNEYLFLDKSKYVNSKENKLQYRKIDKLNTDVSELILSDPNEGEWTVGTINIQIKKNNASVIMGYDGDNPIGLFSMQSNGKMVRVDNVFIKYDKRGNGYGHELVRYMINYFFENYSNHIFYLYSSSEIALKIYKKYGFIDINENLYSWSAWYE